MSNDFAQVRVNRRAAARLDSGHPWIFVSDVVDRGQAEPGSVVEVCNERGRSLAMAHYSSTSQIALRVLGPKCVPVDAAFFAARIQAAFELRQRAMPGAEACRVVYSEADFLPGLVVDRYGDCLAVQLLSQGMDRARPLIVEALTQVLHPAGILARNDAPVRDKESLPREIAVLAGEIPPTVEFTMNGLKLEADLAGGQKTGVFLDQRENYVAAARYAHGRALDCFTCTGGFALHLARVCEHVTAVDSSAAALETAKRNAARNGIGNIDWTEANVFDLLNSSGFAARRFDTIVLDPPAFAKSRGSLEAAMRGYKEINVRALKMLAPHGTLVTCSCSHHLSEAALAEVVAAAALDAGRNLRVLERRLQAPDHPILLTAPETLYLKCLVLDVV